MRMLVAILAVVTMAACSSDNKPAEKNKPSNSPQAQAEEFQANGHIGVVGDGENEFTQLTLNLPTSADNTKAESIIVNTKYDADKDMTVVTGVYPHGVELSDEEQAEFEKMYFVECTKIACAEVVIFRRDDSEATKGTGFVLIRSSEIDQPDLVLRSVNGFEAMSIDGAKNWQARTDFDADPASTVLPTGEENGTLPSEEAAAETAE